MKKKLFALTFTAITALAAGSASAGVIIHDFHAKPTPGCLEQVLAFFGW